MKKSLVLADGLHLQDGVHLKLGKILSLAVFLMVLFASSGQRAKSEDGVIWTKEIYPSDIGLLNAVFSPDDQFIYATVADNEYHEPHFVYKYDMQGNMVDSVMNVGGIKQFSKDGKYFWNFYGDKYDATTFEKIYSFAGGIVDNINDWNLEINEAANLGIACSQGKKLTDEWGVQYDSCLIIVDLTDGNIIRYSAHPESKSYDFGPLGISPDGSKVAFTTSKTAKNHKQEEYTTEMHIEVWRLPEFVKEKQINLDFSNYQQTGQKRFRFSPDGSVLGYQHAGRLTLYSTTDYSVVWESGIPYIRNFAWSNDMANLVFSTGTDGMYKLDYKNKIILHNYPNMNGSLFIDFTSSNFNILCSHNTRWFCLLDNTITSITDPFFSTEYKTTLLQNQTNNNYQLQIIANQPNLLSYSVLDVKGNILIPNLKQNLEQGINQFDIETSGLPSGSYFINIEIAGHSQTSKFIVVR